MKRVQAALAGRTEVLELFFRNDDAGWAQEPLDRMLDTCAETNIPIDLAVIPAALEVQTAQRLDQWRRDHPGIGLHQHGFAHSNHEPEGSRKCEFGASRSTDRQRADIAAGRMRLTAMLGETDPIFTPPWNRIMQSTAEALAEDGFQLVSDDGALAKVNCKMTGLPISFDWEKYRREGRLEDALVQSVASRIAPLGIMLHHETMDQSARKTLREFLLTIQDTQAAVPRPMRRWIGAAI